MIDHMLFDKHKYISDVQILNGFIDTKLIGKTITRSNYKVYWANVAGGVAGGSEMDFGVDDSSLSTEIPDDVDTYSITSTGEIYSLKLSEQQTPYFLVNLHETVDHGVGDGVHVSFVKASDVMKRVLAGESL
ncbi:MAG: hypothetical protein ACTHV0_00100 [Lactobacillus helveticus]|uniref:hypothetical protein n=1 Tax=Lactobacillus helveticus TaxID=1587 RepID=UPI0003584041|nr:hypothetical protein [Lactobacillus helveticus]AGQ23678.1 hypothetical protein lhe_1194 [Lactobacillus helveticus CNRZ32]KXN77092.1 hypothetical protein AY471_03325 [Lactobacillus helveticus]MBW7999336.1 hypothetical protein [Lactobacillus helveticus]MBW8063254.1 hypothetical protein [Lactobacillus helveticus]MCT3406222.1 hypothetical protein [Lactobacillus helveticus]